MATPEERRDDTTIALKRPTKKQLLKLEQYPKEPADSIVRRLITEHSQRSGVTAV